MPEGSVGAVLPTIYVEIQNISSDFAIFYVPDLFINKNLTTFAVLIPGSP
jgi:hypothetical protein